MPTGRHPADWAAEVERYGAGEILLNSIDQDGAGHGYDIALVRSVVDAVKVPVIALGGVGEWEQLEEGVVKSGASGVAGVLVADAGGGSEGYEGGAGERGVEGGSLGV